MTMMMMMMMMMNTLKTSLKRKTTPPYLAPSLVTVANTADWCHCCQHGALAVDNACYWW
jgi:hypothetical protein